MDLTDLERLVASNLVALVLIVVAANLTTRPFVVDYWACAAAFVLSLADVIFGIGFWQLGWTGTAGRIFFLTGLMIFALGYLYRPARMPAATRVNTVFTAECIVLASLNVLLLMASADYPPVLWVIGFVLALVVGVMVTFMSPSLRVRDVVYKEE